MLARLVTASKESTYSFVKPSELSGLGHETSNRDGESYWPQGSGLPLCGVKSADGCNRRFQHTEALFKLVMADD